MIHFWLISIYSSFVTGDWILILVHFYKYLKLQNENVENSTLEESNYFSNDKNGSLLFFISAATIGSYTIYFTVGGILHVSLIYWSLTSDSLTFYLLTIFLQWYFYVRQRDKSHEWKCQPGKFLTPEMERLEIIIGTCSLSIVSTITGIIAWYAANDGRYLKVYYQPDEYGWIWFFLQIPVVFVYQVSWRS